ncbi:hypothetical protein HZ326_26994 [Fusarium oxysporum f. sp. albedinis]|nr:hypothetical protein HZ326_26994 [Fusarium oxysporum f. sp. albedinis]
MNADRLIDALKAQAEGLEVLGRQDSKFDDRCLYYNRSLNYLPLAIVRPTKADQVSKVVSFCTAQNIPLAVRSGGHDFYGRSLVDNGVVVDMRSLSSVNVADDQKSASVGGGVIAGDLQQALAKHGLFTPTGQAKTVGYVSWACGGGYGFYVGTYGFGVDQILGARVVLADGRIRDTDHDKELLWALRGAGAGTFGIIVELRVKVYPTPKIYAGFLAFPISEASAVLEQFQQMNADGDIPDAFSGDAIVANPEMLQLTVKAEPAYIFYWCWTAVQGDLSEARAYLRKMESFGTILINTIQESKHHALFMSWAKSLLQNCGDSSSPTYFRSCNFTDVLPDVGKVLALNPPPQTLSAVVVHNNHGKGVRQDIKDGIGVAFPNRRRHVILGLHGGTHENAHNDRDALGESTAWVRHLQKQLSSLNCHLKERFPAFCSPDDVDSTTFFGLDAARRLSRLKAKLDPNNVFNKAFPRLMATSTATT